MVSQNRWSVVGVMVMAFLACLVVWMVPWPAGADGQARSDVYAAPQPADGRRDMGVAIAEAEKVLAAARTEAERSEGWRNVLVLYGEKASGEARKGLNVEALITLRLGLEREKESGVAGSEGAIVDMYHLRFVDGLVHGDGMALMEILKSRRIAWAEKRVIIEYLAEAVQKEYSPKREK